MVQLHLLKILRYACPLVLNVSMHMGSLDVSTNGACSSDEKLAPTCDCCTSLKRRNIALAAACNASIVSLDCCPAGDVDGPAQGVQSSQARICQSNKLILPYAV